MSHKKNLVTRHTISKHNNHSFLILFKKILVPKIKTVKQLRAPFSQYVFLLNIPLKKEYFNESKNYSEIKKNIKCLQTDRRSVDKIDLKPLKL